MSSYTPILPDELVVGSPVKPSIVQRLDANDQSVPSPMVFLAGALNTWTAPESKWYKITMTGEGGNGSSSDPGGGAASGIRRIYVEKGTLWTATFNPTGIGATNTVFSDGVTTLSVQNGFDPLISSGGAGQTSSGMDITFIGSGNNSIYGGLPRSGQPAPFGVGGRVAGTGGPALIIIEG